MIVCGGGHAGIEASLIASRLGCRVALVSLDTSSIGRMSCNPAIGGLAKGQLVKEIDVLGGIMGAAAGNLFQVLHGFAAFSAGAVVAAVKDVDLVLFAFEISNVLWSSGNYYCIYDGC